MIALAHSLKDFQNAVKEGDSIGFDEEGNWYSRNIISQLFRRLFGYESDDDMALSKNFGKFLKHYELPLRNTKIGFRNTSYTLQDIEETLDTIKERLSFYYLKEKEQQGQVKEKKNAYKQQILNLQKSVTIEIEELVHAEKHYAHCKKNLLKIREKSLAEQQIFDLQKRLIALKYLSKTQEEIHSGQPDTQSDQEWVKNKLLKWKKEQYPKLSDDFSLEEQQKIAALCDYPEIIALLKTYPLLREQYMRFLFRNSIGAIKDSPDIIVQFPSIQKTLSKAFLDKRIKRFGNNGCEFVQRIEEISETTFVQKDITLLIDGVKESILDPTRKVKIAKPVIDEAHAHSIENTLILTIDEVIKTFQNKNKEIGTLEYSAQRGVVFYEPKKPMINCELEQWWKKWANDFGTEILSREELQKRFEGKFISQDFSSGHALLVLKGSRQTPDKNVRDNHAWFECYFPIGNEQFALLAPGKYAAVYPTGILGTIFYIFQTVLGIVTLFDENEFYYHRETGSFPIVIDKEHLERFMEKIKESIKTALNGGLYFQAQGNNCFEWFEDILKGTFPEKAISDEFFEMDALEPVGPYPVSILLNFIKWMDNWSLGDTTRKIISLGFGAWLGCDVIEHGETVTKRLIQNKRWNSGKIALPVLIFENGKKLQEACAI